MARKQRSLLGIELQEHEIRVVEARHAGPRPVITAVGVAPMPPGALQDGVVVRADAVAQSIQRLLDKLKVSTRDAVIGVPSNGVLVRSLNLPPSPESELGILVDGEVRHYQMIRSQGGAYGYFRTVTPAAGDAASTPTTVLLMGSEEPVVAALREVSKDAGLHVVALEPTHVGLYRAAAGDLPTSGTSMLLTISDWRTDIVVVSGGQICVYRRIDVGFQSLLRERQAKPKEDAPPPADDDMILRMEPQEEPTAGITDAAGTTMAVEVRRSIEYFTREFSSSPPIEKVLVVGNDSSVEGLVEWLSSAVHLEVEIATPSEPMTASREVALEFEPPAGVRYSAAYGFAIRDVEMFPVAVPRLDLYVHERSVAEMEVKRRGLAGALLASIVSILVGVGAAYAVGMKANEAEDRVLTLTRELGNLENINRKSADLEIQKQERLNLLAKDGLPVTSIMDSVAQSLPANVGLSTIRVMPGGRVDIAGETTAEDGMIRFTENLQQSSLMNSVYVMSFERMNSDAQSKGLTFRITSMAATGTPVTSAPTPQANPGSVASQ
jgi:type IV pilus assembly protein PilM